MFADIISVAYHININTQVHKLLVFNYSWYKTQYSSTAQHAISCSIPPLPPMDVREFCTEVCIRVAELHAVSLIHLHTAVF